MSRLENGLSFAETIFWGHGFHKTLADSLFLNSAGFSPQILPAERGLGNECGQNLNSFWKGSGQVHYTALLQYNASFSIMYIWNQEKNLEKI